MLIFALKFPVLAHPFLAQSVVLPSHFQVHEKSPASILHLGDLKFENSNLDSHFLICVPSYFITLNYDFEAIFLLQILYLNSFSRYLLQHIRDNATYNLLQQIRDTCVTDL